MSQNQQPQFLDVQRLVQESEPVRRGGWLWYALALMGMMVILSSLARSQAPAGAGTIELVSSIAMLALLAGSMYVMFNAARAVQREQQRLEAIQELIQLRRWSDAAAMIEHMLSGPTQTPQGRFQALVFLATVLARYHRFHDAVELYERLLNIEGLDPASSHGLKLGRAMSLLRDDRLYDADRAIVDLRRGGAGVSAGLELVEIYRDVKTGHPQDALERFDRQLGMLKRALGCRTADAWGLVAGAKLMLGDAPGAQRTWQAATALVPAVELVRRYPELSGVSQACAAAAMPQEAA
ncbi:MAG: tetratricopeptide repeat protein [Tepidisphaerales bacterium]